MHPLPAASWLVPGRGPYGLTLTGILLLLLYGLGSLPGAASQMGQTFGSDKLLHALFYGMLAVVQQFTWSRHHLALTLLVVGVSGAVDEAIQSLFPYRSASWDDWFTNMAAALCVSVVFWLWRKRTVRD